MQIFNKIITLSDLSQLKLPYEIGQIKKLFGTARHEPFCFEGTALGHRLLLNSELKGKLMIQFV